MKNLRNNKGFTLIEMMIVVAIIGILAAIAIPQFERFEKISRRTEGYSVLGGIRTLEVAYFSEYDTFTQNEITIVNLFMGNGTIFIPKYYNLGLPQVADDIKRGYIVGLRGNIDNDVQEDLMVIIAGAPQSALPGYSDGIHVIADDLIL